MKLNIGCGPIAFEGWVNIDIEENYRYWFHVNKPEILPWFRLWDVRKGLPFINDGTVEVIIMSQIIEHLSYKEAVKLLKECYRVMKKDAILRIATPDLEKLISKYLQGKMHELDKDQAFPEYLNARSQGLMLSFIMFGNMSKNCRRENYEGHWMCYDFEALIELLNNAGFNKIVKTCFNVSLSNEMPEEGFDAPAGKSHSMYVEVMK